MGHHGRIRENKKRRGEVPKIQHDGLSRSRNPHHSTMDVCETPRPLNATRRNPPYVSHGYKHAPGLSLQRPFRWKVHERMLVFRRQLPTDRLAPLVSNVSRASSLMMASDSVVRRVVNFVCAPVVHSDSALVCPGVDDIVHSNILCSLLPHDARRSVCRYEVKRVQFDPLRLSGRPTNHSAVSQRPSLAQRLFVSPRVKYDSEDARWGGSTSTFRLWRSSRREAVAFHRRASTRYVINAVRFHSLTIRSS